MLTFAPSEADGETRAFAVVEREIALTFDDGPDPRFTPAILDILRERGARATFFVVGEQAQRYPELIERILAEGHEIAHHTHSHPHMDRLSEAEVAAEMDECLAELRGQGAEPRWYRPPRAKFDDTQDALAAERGMRVAMWARCLERQRFRTAEEMAYTVAAETCDGDIVLAHDGLLDRSRTVEALPLYLGCLEDCGIRSVTLSELAARSGRD